MYVREFQALDEIREMVMYAVMRRKALLRRLSIFPTCDYKPQP